MDDDLDEESMVAAENSILYLHTYTDIQTEETMHLPISIHDHKLLALLDGGLTQNFINTRVVCRIELVIGACNLLVTVTM